MMCSSDSMDSMDTIVSDDTETESPMDSLFEIGEPDDEDLTLVIEEPMISPSRTSALEVHASKSTSTRSAQVQQDEVEIIEEETLSPKRRLSVSDHILGRVQKLLKKRTKDGDVEFLPYISGASEYQPTVRHAKYDPILARDDFDDNEGAPPKHLRSMLGYAAHHGLYLFPAEIKDNWEHFVKSTPTAAPRLSIAPPPAFKWGAMID